MIPLIDSKLWCEERCHVLLHDAHCKAQFDWFPVFPLVTPHFQSFHKWVAESRKKAVGLPLAFPISRRLVTGVWAATAGTQWRRTATLPLVSFEVEPGEAIRIFGHAVHPFFADADMPTDVLAAVRFQSQPRGCQGFSKKISIPSGCDELNND